MKKQLGKWWWRVKPTFFKKKVFSKEEDFLRNFFKKYGILKEGKCLNLAFSKMHHEKWRAFSLLKREEEEEGKKWNGSHFQFTKGNSSVSHLKAIMHCAVWRNEPCFCQNHNQFYYFQKKNLYFIQDKVDGNEAEINLNNNWENV